MQKINPKNIFNLPYFTLKYFSKFFYNLFKEVLINLLKNTAWKISPRPLHLF
ncbi:hypothetical protein CHY_1796 [Carboxydothermus hydrogenoformans Z-2901]|uniref:Uncharacterized protein n=1 Tax=Carboxydothermus hydrogenoformans (strain ATCC BAA-161 / DSM 6008 / Z-2901) TaxID=246194 RepID=Q3AB68_CARHZ|nr:hypothetical protein CHY_1796 [Carboxydothermus hydrogenoformans Z-2901]